MTQRDYLSITPEIAKAIEEGKYVSSSSLREEVEGWK